jgi:type I restriction enzyme R subunit
MVFFSQKVLRTMPGNWTFVIVTDRDELDGQIYKTFAATGAVTEGEAQANSGAHLKQLLTEDHRYVFTLIQKFHTENGATYPMLSDRDDVIVITDEAHRSQYDVFALNMRNALPNAAFIGFTGTPLMAGEERTREVFGDYVSVYNFAQSIEDKATVPLYYENRIPELQLTNKNLNEDMERLLEAAELSPEQERKLEREFGREYHLITRDDRLEAVAEDIVTHFMGRGYRGKAMVVCIDKATAVKMYDKVAADWQQHLAALRARLPKTTGEEHEGLKDKIAFMAATDMAVVVSQAQNEVEEMRAKGLDIVPHRRRMVTENLDEKFKNPDDPFRLVFVCAMWMTGFDVPSCSTIYLDKPMRNHTLMQTIARANRVMPGKVAGLIVDYVGVFKSLQKALAIYAPRPDEGDEKPIKDKSELVAALRTAIEALTAWCEARGVAPGAIKGAVGFGRVRLLDDAVEATIVDDETKKSFLQQATQITRIFRAILPDPLANELAPDAILFSVLAEKIRALTPAPDISEVMGKVEELLDASIAAEGYIIHDVPEGEDKLIDLSRIDFEKLRKRFETARKRTEAEKLRALIEGKLQAMIALNKARMDFLEKFQKLIAAYNAGSKNIEQLFAELIKFAQSLNAEEKRGMAEGLTEEELALFDILTKPDPKLTKAQEVEVKRVVKELLDILKAEKLVLDWRSRQQARAAVRQWIEIELDKLPEAYTPEIFETKCDLAYRHVYDHYVGPGESVYEGVGP